MIASGEVGGTWVYVYDHYLQTIDRALREDVAQTTLCPFPQVSGDETNGQRRDTIPGFHK
jgi:hypothetical protein